MQRQEALDRLHEVRRSKHLFSWNEAQTRHELIDPILAYLGWDLDNPREVHRPYVFGGGNEVDYALLLNDEPRAFVEAKKLKENLDLHEFQLVRYLVNYAIDIAVLTNGLEWRIYFPLFRGPLEERTLALDANTQVLTDLVEHLHSILDKDSIITGSWKEIANTYLTERRNRSTGRRAVKQKRKTTPVAQTMRGKTKYQMVFEALYEKWCTGDDLTQLTGQPGGWPKYCYNIYIASGKYGDVVLLKRGKSYRIVDRAAAESHLKDKAVSVYKP